MKLLLQIVALCLLFSSCKRYPASTIIEELPKGIRYEVFEDIANGARVLTLHSPNVEAGFEIVIPGDVLWCDIQGNVIVGEKTSLPLPAPWMDSNWERSGYFILNPSAINFQAVSDEEKFSQAVSWFNTKEEFEKAISSSPIP